MPQVRLGGIGLDCSDPTELAEFWAALLDGSIVYSSADVVAVRVGDLLLNAYRVEDHCRASWPGGLTPKQAHLDIAVDDLTSADQRARALGATRAAWQPDPSSYLVLIDPAGHPFCLTTQIPD